MLLLRPTFGFIVTTPASRCLPASKRKYDDCSNFSHCGRTKPTIVKLNAQIDPHQRGSEILKAEAEALKAKADKLRSEIEENAFLTNGKNVADPATNTAVATNNDSFATTVPISPWAVVSTEPKEEGNQQYRLYVDIGREEGTWMDPRWGASGKRIEFSLDIGLIVNRLAAPEISKKMIQDNTVGKSSQVFALETARFARLRDGFDRMECKVGGGAYRVDMGKSGRSTIRIVIEVEGTNKADQSYIYGDVSIPAGCLYFSLPCFGSGTSNLSIKEGLVSVRQVGWHTGWRREESRICGVFTAKSLPEAKKKDRF